MFFENACFRLATNFLTKIAPLYSRLHSILPAVLRQKAKGLDNPQRLLPLGDVED
jgi:hypothetical protein